jgi:signal peptidase I
MARIKKLIRENKGFLVFLFAMIMVRSAIADWYGVPSASMYPTLLIGDRIFTNRLAYDIKLPFTDVIVKHMDDPKRGDIVTFSSPEDGLRLVKRVVGLPGDSIEMRGDELIVNGSKASYAEADGDLTKRLSPDYRGQQLVLTEQVLGHQRPIIVMPERSAVRSFGPVVVPDGEYLVLGDNRDNSKDSRYIGFVKRELLTGQVMRVIFSLDTDKFYMPRVERFGATLL